MVAQRRHAELAHVCCAALSLPRRVVDCVVNASLVGVRVCVVRGGGCGAGVGAMFFLTPLPRKEMRMGTPKAVDGWVGFGEPLGGGWGRGETFVCLEGWMNISLVQRHSGLLVEHEPYYKHDFRLVVEGQPGGCAAVRLI